MLCLLRKGVPLFKPNVIFFNFSSSYVYSNVFLFQLMTRTINLPHLLILTLAGRLTSGFWVIECGRRPVLVMFKLKPEYIKETLKTCILLDHKKKVYLPKAYRYFLEDSPIITTSRITVLTLSWRSPLSYRNQYIDLWSKSMDWFLYDNDLRHERVNIWSDYEE